MVGAEKLKEYEGIHYIMNHLQYDSM